MCINVPTWNIKVGQNKDGSYPISKTENLDRIAVDSLYLLECRLSI